MHDLARATPSVWPGSPPGSIVDLRAVVAKGHDRLVETGNEMADCLQRFLTASADGPTLQRAHEALLLWSSLESVRNCRRA
jgi:hypothetical protein